MISSSRMRPLQLMAATLLSCHLLQAQAETSFTTSLDFFYPGAMSWEAVLTPASHEGARSVRQRKPCLACHEGDEKMMGQKLAASAEKPLPTGSKYWYQSSLKIRRDADAIEFTLSTADMPEGQISLLFDDGTFDSSALSGCWSACHQDSIGMPAAADMSLSKYLSRSRTHNTREGGGLSFKSDSELAKLLNQGEFLEMIGARFKADQLSPVHAYVLQAREALPANDLRVTRSTVDGKPALTLRRPLAARTTGEKQLQEGKEYSIGIAIHQGDNQHSEHLVSFPVRFTLEPGGDIRQLKTETQLVAK